MAHCGGFREILAPHHIRSAIHERRCQGRRPHHSHVHSQRGGLRRGRAISGARNDPMTTATITRSLSFGGAPLSAWAFGIRIWVAVVVALAASFWLELEAPPRPPSRSRSWRRRRGVALHKTTYRLIATLIGATPAIGLSKAHKGRGLSQRAQICTRPPRCALAPPSPRC